MRVAILTTSYPLQPGQAAGHFVAAEAEALCRQGHDVTVIAPGRQRAEVGSAPRLVWIESAGLFGPPGALHRLRANPWRARGALMFVVAARRQLRREGPFDKLIAHWLIPCAWPIASARALQLEAVAHGSDVRLFCALPRSLRLYIAHRLMRQNVLLRCVSEPLRESLIDATTPGLRRFTRVEACPIELPSALDRLGARARLGVGACARLVVIVSRLIPEKRVATALGAVAALPGIELVVIGGGPLLSALQREFPQVRFTGELPRPVALEWISAADVLLSASKLEGAPTVVREALALGTQVVAHPAGALADWARLDANLWLLPELRSAGMACS